MILRGIAEMAEELSLQQHVLRFWETEFGHLRPMRRGRRRYYRAEDVYTLRGICVLLHDRGLTLDGLRRVFHTCRRWQTCAPGTAGDHRLS
jgi:DNA-binding transcriptional MerR regulator